MTRQPRAFAAIYPGDAFPHNRWPMRTIEEFGANTLDVSTEDAFKA
jgi:hypothetical protein